MSYGRRKIFTDAAEITAENVVAEVNAAFQVHTDNRNEIIELYRYYRNKTAIENTTVLILIANSVDLVTVAARMRDRQNSPTIDTYAHALQRSNKRTAIALENMLGK